MSGFEKLPEELVIELFSYLSITDRKSLRLASKGICELSSMEPLMKEEVFIIHDWNIDNLNGFVSPYMRTICNLKVILAQPEKRTYSDKNGALFWSQYGSEIKTVEIFGVFNCTALVPFILNNCPNLQYLMLSRFDVLTDEMKNPAVVADTAILHDEPMENPELSEVCLYGSRFYSDYFRLRENVFLQKLTVSQVIADAYQVVDLIKRHSKHLEELGILSSHFGPTTLIWLLNELPDSLTSLTLHTFNLNNDCLIKIADKCPKLKKISLRESPPQPDLSSLNQLFMRLQNLSHVRLINLGPSLNDDILVSLSKLVHLQAFQLSNSKTITDTGITNIFKSKQWPQMIDLRLTDLSEITDAAILGICPNLPKIRYLELDGCPKLDIGFMDCLVKNNKLIKHLSFERNEDDSTRSLLENVHRFPKLLCLKLTGTCENSIRDMKSETLEYLIWGGFSNYSKLFYSHIFTQCPSLKHIFVDRPIKSSIHSRDLFLDEWCYFRHRFSIDRSFGQGVFFCKIERDWGAMLRFYKERKEGMNLVLYTEE